jgi:tetratricopeptide (TPR) repeat protein
MTREAPHQDPRALWQEKLDFYRAEEAKAADPAQKFLLHKAIEEATAKLADLDEEDRTRAAAEALRIDLSHLPSGAEHFLGRGPELAALDAAWAPGASGPGQTAICECIAPGGTGKTALVKRWLDRVRANRWGDAARVYAWSFYSQGTGDDRQASEDLFLAKALDWFEVDIAPAAHPADKGQALAEAVAARRTLLVLDGCEPLQHPPGPLAGELRAPGLKALLTHLASAGQPGLCVLTSREWLQDLAEWVRSPGHPGGPVLRPVLRLDLGNLDDADGACLLHTLGADRAGAAGIKPNDPELMAASREVRGHALTLSLLGRYLALAEDGDVRRRDRVDLAAASEATGGHAFRVMAAYERWLGRPHPGSGTGADAGEAANRELAALRLFGYFDRPAIPELLEALRAAPPIPGLTEALFDLPAADASRSAGVPPATARSAVGAWEQARKLWGALTGRVPAGSRRSQIQAEPMPAPIGAPRWRTALARIEGIGLVAPPGPDGSRDAHPLVREYLAAALKAANPNAFREGHRRLYERLKASAPHRPEGLAGLQPLYQAVAHGCQAGLWQEVCDQVYADRILRGTGHDGFYSWKKLGAFGANLGALACLFAEPWTRPAPALTEPAQAWLLNEAALNLRALGRLGEALGPMRAGTELYVKQENWKSAAASYENLSELQLTLGLVLEAVADARRSVDHADRSGAAASRIDSGTTVADALHQQGETAEALARFAEAEAMQAQFQPAYPLLYSLRGFQYCDLLLAGAEGTAWSGAGCGAGGGAGGGAGQGAGGAGDPAAGACEAVAGRARQTLPIAEANNWLLDIALDHLTLARCALYVDLLAGRPPGAEAEIQAGRALDRLRAAGQQQYIPRGLLTRAWLRQAQGDTPGAQADLAEAEHIASRGGMALFLADIALHRARLFRDPQALAQARRLIEAHHYGRRLPELADAEAAAKGW